MNKIENMKFYAYHGCNPEERRVGNEFYVTVEYAYDMLPAAKADDLELAVDYAAIYRIVSEQMAKPSNLLENVTLRIVKAIREAFPQIIKGTVTVVKMHPPVGGACEKAEVSMEF